MKKLFIITMLLCGLFTSCSNNTTKEEGIHQHEDGSTHEDHGQATDTVKQEEFMVDSTSMDTTTHTHDGSEDHKH